MTRCYITVGSNDLDRSMTFYEPVMTALGAEMVMDMPGIVRAYTLDEGFQIWVTKTQNGQAAEPGNGHTAGLYTDSPDMVRAAHKAALENGGTCEGEPGPRPLYGPEVYAAYARDPDGNKLAFVTFVKGGAS